MEKPVPVRVRRCRLFETRLQTRLPFRFGIATLTDLPHVFAQVEADVNGGAPVVGVAADHLPPKWFTKNPNATPNEDIAELRTVVRHALRTAEQIGGGPSVFAAWRALYDAQAAWGAEQHLAPLMTGFGTSLVERAIIDAVCRATGQTFVQALRAGTLGLTRLGELHPELGDQAPGDLLPAAPRDRVFARHTVGLSDPLTDDEIAPGDRLEDGLPLSLVANIRRYGLRHFKIKISGDAQNDVARLQAIAPVLAGHAPPDYAFSLDGNEGYPTVAAFRAFWDRVCGTSDLAPFLEHLLFVEQPLHRDVALSDAVGALNRDWPHRPLTIIDESDAEIHSLPRALELGYAGTSHKNCKGVFKGVANACLLAHRARLAPPNAHPALLLSGEDLTTIGPVSLQQDLAVQAALGVASVERNGQHYFAGMSQFPPEVQRQVLAEHPDLFHANSVGGWPTLTITNGALDLGSVNAAPFGTRILPDMRWFEDVTG
jgi:hypothetical protein